MGEDRDRRVVRGEVNESKAVNLEVGGGIDRSLLGGARQRWPGAPCWCVTPRVLVSLLGTGVGGVQLYSWWVRVL